jgi:hypothetical protein
VRRARVISLFRTGRALPQTNQVKLGEITHST